MQFNFATSERILFGEGTFHQIGTLAAEMGQRALVVSGQRGGAAAAERLAAAAVEAVSYAVAGEPTTAVVQGAADLARAEGCDLVIGFGGGSAIDTAKAVAALLRNPGNVFDYLEVVGKGLPLGQPSVPCIAAPTTAGTGAEVTRNAVLSIPEQKAKVSLRSRHMLPRLALVDPELTYSLPQEVTASTGLDALTQLIESYLSNQSNPLTDAIAVEGMRRAARSLPRAYQEGDPDSRRDMSLASLMGGLALANSKLGAVHGFAGALGGMIEAPHGAICARLLPFVFAQNIRALEERAPASEARRRFDQVAQILTGSPDARGEDGSVWLEGLAAALAVASLGDFGLRRDDFPEAIAKSARASSMQGNPVVLTYDEMLAVLEKAL